MTLVTSPVRSFAASGATITTGTAIMIVVATGTAIMIDIMTGIAIIIDITTGTANSNTDTGADQAEGELRV